VVWFQPHFRGATAQTDTVPGTTTIEATPFDYDFEISGRYWLGARADNGVGARVRYWQWEHLAARAVSFDEVVDLFHRIELATLDAELTQDWQLGAATLRVGGGLRYLRLNQQYGATVNDPFGPPERLRYRQSFEGIGPTISAEWLRPIGLNLSAYAQVRGAVTFGERNERLSYTFSGLDFTISRTGVDEVISVGELGVGLQADLGPLFIRGGYEGQIWWNTGGPNGGGDGMGLHGFSIGAGLIY